MNNQDSDSVRDIVRAGYAAIARGETASCCGPSSCACGDTAQDAESLAKAVGYTPEQLASLPEGANLGLSCGNPVALAGLQPGEVVVDLGSGAGFDIFQAGLKVGATGRAIGVDMTPDMLQKARGLIRSYRERSGLDNVEFRMGEIEHLPLADNSVDCIVSNCVLNLSPDKAQVFREIFRVLKPGGRVAISDLAPVVPLPAEVARMAQALVGCVSGAALVEENRAWAVQSGLLTVELRLKPGYVDAMESWQDPLYREIIAALPQDAKLGEYITSMELTARKPLPLRRSCC